MADGVDTLPAGLPDLTLGWGVLQHATQWLVQPNGPRAGKPWTPTDRQARFTLWWYAVGEDGRWLYHHGVRRLAKGSGKSPFAAVLALEELIGPVRLADFDPDAMGGCIGKPVDMALVQIAATAESQTANTMRMVRAMAAKNSRVVNAHGIKPGIMIFYTPTGELQVITSSASAAEGAEVTFAVEDETEHWTPATGGPELASTMDRNLAKSSSRGIETANAWQPGAESVAETTYEAWRAQQDGRTRGTSQILYDACIAPADTDLSNEESLTAALEFVYDDCFWVDLQTIKDRIYDPRTLPDVSRRFYLNQPTAAEDAWVTPMEWQALRAVATKDDDGNEIPARQVVDGESVVLFFDGSKSRDATGIAGCAMSDGHVFTVGAWEPSRNDPDDTVPTDEVDAVVASSFDRWDVIAFFADVKEWEGFTKVTWPKRHGDSLLVHAVTTGKDPGPIAWDMRSKAFDFTAATELARAEIVDRSFTHDGEADGADVMSRHVVNARRRRGRYGIHIGKESKDSPNKIDLAICMIGARMVRRIVLANPDWQKRQRKTGRRSTVLVID